MLLRCELVLLLQLLAGCWLLACGVGVHGVVYVCLGMLVFMASCVWWVRQWLTTVAPITPSRNVLLNMDRKSHSDHKEKGSNSTPETCTPNVLLNVSLKM